MPKELVKKEKQWKEQVRKMCSVDVTGMQTSDISPHKPYRNCHHASDISESINLDSSGKSVLSLMSFQSCSGNTEDSLHSDILRSYKKTDSLNERLLKFNRLKKKGSAPKLNIFSTPSIKKPVPLVRDSLDSSASSFVSSSCSSSPSRYSNINGIYSNDSELCSAELFQGNINESEFSRFDREYITSKSTLTMDKILESSDCAHNLLIHHSIHHKKSKINMEKYPHMYLAGAFEFMRIDTYESKKNIFLRKETIGSINIEEELKDGKIEIYFNLQKKKINKIKIRQGQFCAVLLFICI